MADSDLSLYLSDSDGSDLTGFDSDDDNLPIAHFMRNGNNTEQNLETDHEETDEEDIVQIDAQWTHNLTCVNKRAFSGLAPGAVIILDAEKKEIDFIKLFFPDTLLEK
jgi:hypothetical protein